MARTGVAMLAGIGVAILASGGAQAQDRAVRLSQAAISAGDLGSAEARLTAERRIFPSKPEVLLNLAAVYARTGRAGQAVTLYRDILSRQDALMDLPSGRVASAHTIARAGLARLSPGIATR